MLTSMIDTPIDPTLPALGPFLDSEAILEVSRAIFGDAMQGGPSTWNGAQLIEALYHPSKYIRVVYALAGKGTIPSNRLWPQSQLVYLHAPVRNPMSRRGTIVNVGGTPTEVYRFPNDRRLRFLRKLSGRGQAASQWQGWISELGDDFQMDPDSLRRVLIRYVPEQKWIIRLRVRGVSANSSTPGKRSIAVRLASPDACAELVSRHQHLARWSQAEQISFRIPSIVGADPSNGVVAMEWIRGQSFLDMLQSGSTEDLMRGVARRLRSFHLSEVPGLDLQRSDHLIQKVRNATTDLIHTCPEIESLLASLGRELADRLARLDLPGAVVLHNDFHWKQVTVDGDRLALFDLERLCRGDALIDVANFATQLQMLGFRAEANISPEVADEWRSVFLDAWLGFSGDRLDITRYSCYAALARLELARGMMRHLRPGWRGLAIRCCEMAADDLGSSTSGGNLP